MRTSDPELTLRAKIVEGKLCEKLGRFDGAEAAWKQALAVNANSEAGWLLLSLYELQERDRDRRELALRLSRLCLSPLDRRRALLDLVRQDVHHQAAAGTISRLAPVVDANPADLRSGVALGRALARG